MILQFLKRDPAWQITPWLAAAAAAVCHSAFHASWMPLTLIGPVYLVTYMRTRPHQRVTFFEAALPVSGRQLFLARCLALLGMIWLPAAACISVFLVAGETQWLPYVLLIALPLTVAVLTTLSVRIREFAAPGWLTMFCPVTALCAMIPLVSLKEPLLVILACTAASVLLSAFAWRSAPEVFQSASMAMAEPQRTARAGAPSLPWWPVLRSLAPWQTAIFVPVSLIWVATGDWIFAPMYLMMAYSQTRVTTRWTQALPISRRTILCLSVIPLLMVLAVGAEVGMLTGLAQKSSDLIRLGDQGDFRLQGAVDVVVNVAFWERAPGGKIPVIRAPWGETYQPKPKHVLGLTFFNPYSDGQKNSPEFQDWQYARATTRIYGKPVPARYLAKAVKAGLRPVTLYPRMQILNLAAVLAGGLFWAWMVELLSWHRLTRLSTGLRNALSYSLALAPIGLILGVDIFVGGAPGSISRGALEGGLLHASELLPANLGLTALAALVPLAGLWWILDRQAAAAEISTTQTQARSFFDRG
ncbi:MAG TPA: hypothetical protein VG456_07315 [Candidatus Sulfopaludibacter sp.]|jgi:hypothetical protein|nr:hypothetical protein [Candidatus Sulfopaludibacter sp.]